MGLAISSSYPYFAGLKWSTMKIHHIAFWVRDLEKMRTFYEQFFAAKAGERYHNPTKHFHSYFLTFDEGAQLELMFRPDIPGSTAAGTEQIGITHLAISLGSPRAVDELTETLRAKGYPVIGEPRVTGDGYYESIILDPEDNRIELTV